MASNILFCFLLLLPWPRFLLDPSRRKHQRTKKIFVRLKILAWIMYRQINWKCRSRCRNLLWRHVIRRRHHWIGHLFLLSWWGNKHVDWIALIYFLSISDSNDAQASYFLSGNCSGHSMPSPISLNACNHIGGEEAFDIKCYAGDAALPIAQDSVVLRCAVVVHLQFTNNFLDLQITLQEFHR